MRDVEAPAAPGGRMALGDRLAALGLAALVVVWGALHTGRDAFWLDEAYTAVAAERSWSGLLHFLGHEAGMGPYYLTLWGWESLGSSEAWLRMLSVLGGAAAVAATYLFVVRRIDRRVALAAAVLLFSNSTFLHYVIELRAYSWAMAMAVISTALFLRFREAPTTAHAVWWGASVGLMLGLLVFTAGLVLVQVLWCTPLIRSRSGRLRVGVAAVTAAVVLGPFLPAMVGSDQLSWIPPLTPHRFEVYTAGAMGGTWWTLVLALGNACLAATFVVPRLRRPADAAMHVVVCGLLALPIVLALMSLVTPYYLLRYLLPMLPLAVIGATAGFLRLAQALPIPHMARRAALGVVVALGVVLLRNGLVANMARPEDLAAPARLLAAQVRPGDAVVFDAALVEEALAYYWTPDVAAFAQDAPGRTFPEPDVAYCHVWFMSRTSPAELLAALGREASDPNVSVQSFVGYSVAEVEFCPG